MTAEQYISLLLRVRTCVPRSMLRYDATLAQDIDAAIGDQSANLSYQLMDANWGDWDGRKMSDDRPTMYVAIYLGDPSSDEPASLKVALSPGAWNSENIETPMHALLTHVGIAGGPLTPLSIPIELSASAQWLFVDGNLLVTEL